MDERLEIRTLGGLSIQIGGQLVTGFDSRKVPALLVYLACTGHSHPREILAEMLWEERSQAQALSNLRVALHSLNQAVGDYVEISRETVELKPGANVWLDAAEFESQLEMAGTDAARLADAADFYQGDFLAGFYVDSTTFEQWATRERERLRLRAMEGLDSLIAAQVTLGEYAAGIAAATRLLDMDPLREETHRQLMDLLWRSGQRGKALEQYETCRQRLADELGVEPTAETTALYERIRAGETPAPLQHAIRSYEIRERIGSGGFGEVYRAWQPVVNRDVAVKVIRPEYANQPDFIRRFEMEAQVVAHLEHPYIVPLYDYWREPGGAYLVMRYLPVSLEERLGSGSLALSETMRLVEQIAAALTAAHRAGIVHHDLKPANILLDSDGNAYLTDFSIAKVLGPSIQTTQEGTLVGSPAYLSPEQIRSEPVTPQSDLYSFGILLYETLTGQSPFPADLSPSALLYRQLSEPLPLVHDLCPDLPPALDDVLQQATAKDPAHRFPDVLALVAAFRQAAGPVSAPLPTRDVSLTPLGERDAEPTWTPADQLLAVRNPYKGLRPFIEADMADFFGREVLVEQLVARLDEDDPLARFLAVVGPSGSGKSSVVRAGLVPALRQGALPGSEQWFFTDLLPGPHPLEEIDLALTRLAANPDLDLLPLLRGSERGLLRAVRRVLPDGATLLVVIDQFEEMFTLADDPAEARHLLDSLYAAVTDSRSPIRVVITLRADFYDRPLLHPDFGTLVSQRTQVVLPLSSEELERAICIPVEQVGVRMEPGLAAAIVADVADQPGALPMLQYALTELFDARRNHTLTLDGYQTIGGVKGALARKAEDVYHALAPADRDAARQVFLRLVTLGEGVEDTRRRTLQTELLALGGDPAVMESVIQAFDRSRLLTFDHDPVTRGPTVEIAHEALLREWGTLRGWLDESRDDVRQQRLLAAAVSEWAQAGHDPDFLLARSRLAQFEDWATHTTLALTQDEHTYLDASLDEHQRREVAERERQLRELALQKRAANRLRTLVAGLAVFLVAALGLAIFAVGQRNDAQDARATSDVNSFLAEAKAAEVQELALVNGARAALNKGDMDTALALAVAANRTDNPSAQARLVLSDAAYAPGTVRTFLQEKGYAIDLSRDGRILLSSGFIASGQPNPIHLWNVETGKLIRDLNGHEGIVWGAIFSPDGAYVLSTANDLTVRLWDVQTGQELRRFDRPENSTDDIWHVRFSPDGSLAYGSFSNTIIEWNVATGAITRLFDQSADIETVGIDITPDGTRALTTDWSGAWLLWDVKSGQILHYFRAQEEAHSDWTAGCFRPDGRTALTASRDGTMILWDLDTYEAIRRFETPNRDSLLRVTCDPTGRLALTTYNVAHLWDLETGEEIPMGDGFSPAARDADSVFMPDGQTVFFAQEHLIHAWDLNYGAEIRHYKPVVTPTNIGLIVTSPNRSMFVASTWDWVGAAQAGPFFLYDMSTGQEIRHFGPGATNGFWNYASSIEFSPDSTTMMAGYGTGQMILWDLSTGEEVRRFNGNRSLLVTGAFSPDGRSFVSGAYDGTVILWDVATGQEIRRLLGHTQQVTGNIIFSPNGQQIISGAADQVIIVWDTNTGQEIRRFTGHAGNIWGLALSPDGRTVVSSADDGSLILWDLATGHEIRRMTGFTGIGGFATFDPAGRTIFMCVPDFGTYQWEVSTGELVRHYPSTYNLVFSPDGHTIYAYDWYNTLYVWRYDSEDELVAWARSHRYVRELTCTERALYQIEPECDAAGIFPTSTAYPTTAPATPTTLPPAVDLAQTTAIPAATDTPPVPPREVSSAQIGDNRGNVAVGNIQVWSYEGRAGEILTVQVMADTPCNWSTRSESDMTPEGGCLDSELAIMAPDGSALAVDWANGNLLAGVQDIDPGVNTDSAFEGLVLPADGLYWIEVSGYLYQTGGAYTLIIESAPPETATVTSTPGP